MHLFSHTSANAHTWTHTENTNILTKWDYTQAVPVMDTILLFFTSSFALHSSSSRPQHSCKLSRFSHVQFFVTLWTAALQAPLCMGFSRQEYWSGLSCPPPRNLPKPGVGFTSLTSLALADGFFTTSTTWQAPVPQHAQK